MSQTRETAASTQTASDSRWTQPPASLLCGLLLGLILLPRAAFAAEFGGINIPAVAERERSAPATFADTARFTLSPCVRLTNSALLERASLLAQTTNTPSRAAANFNLTNSVPPWGTQKSYLIPALEIIGFDVLLNLFDRAYYGCCDYDVDLSSIKRNLHPGWDVDADKFTVNQLGHPYQGSMYHGFARASGLSYWQGLAYTFVGSLFWEIAGETTRPSRNDQISTGFGGSFVGEALFRMSNLWLQLGRGSRFWRELVATAISPPVGFNRLAFDQRFDGIYLSKGPEYYSRMHLGIVSATQDRRGTSGEINRHEGIIDVALDYGLPGKPGYTYNRPFDYFSFQAAASTAIGFASVSTRGLLLGTDYEIGERYRVYGVCTAVTAIWRRRFFDSQVQRFYSARPANGDFLTPWHCREKLSWVWATPRSAPSVASPTSGRINTALRRRHFWRCG